MKNDACFGQCLIQYDARHCFDLVPAWGVDIQYARLIATHNPRRPDPGQNDGKASAARKLTSCRYRRNDRQLRHSVEL